MKRPIRVGLVASLWFFCTAAYGSPQVESRVVALRGEIGVVPPEGSLLARKAGLTVEGVSISEALQRLSRATDVAVAFSPSSLPAGRNVDCPCRDMTVAAALDRILAGSGYGYMELDGQIIILKMVTRETLSSIGALPTVVADPGMENFSEELDTPLDDDFRLPPPPQEAVITGTVVEARSGNPVSGAQVVVVGTRNGTLTNEDGHFRLRNLTSQTVELEVIMMGFRTHRESVRAGASGVIIELTQTAIDLEEIVVTGTAGNQARGAQPAVVSRIEVAEVVAQAPVSTVSQVLKGRVPGIAVTESSGTTGASSRINIRGPASLSLSNEPLVFIDGVRMDSGQRELVYVGGQSLSALNDLNPSDILRIEVVKGPAAATLYGADASAGVIQIFTKRGSAGIPGLVQSAFLEYGLIQPNFTPFANYAQCPGVYTDPAVGHPLCAGLEAGAVVSDNPLVRQGAFGDGHATSFQYSARGGGTDYGYYASLSMTDEDGTTSNNSRELRTGRVNFNWIGTEKLSFDAGVGIGSTRSQLPPGDQTTFGYLIEGGLGSPLGVRYGADGSTLEGGYLVGTASVESMSSILSEVHTLRVTPSAKVQYNPTGWFTNRLTFGGDIQRTDATQFYPRNDGNWFFGDQANGWVQEVNSHVDLLTLDYLGNIKNSFGRDDSFSSDFSFGSQYINRKVHSLVATGVGLTTNSSNLVSSAATNTAGEGYAEQKSWGLFFQEQIGYRDRLFVQFGARVDRNSAFGSDSDAFFLPKVGLSYILSKEPFLEGLSGVVSTLRLRAAYGTTGRSPAPGASLRTYASAPYISDTGVLEPGLIPLNPGNSDLKPERGTELEAGFDAGLFDDRFGVEFTYFEKRTTDLLLQVPQPPSAGFPSRPWQNVGEVLNRGVEFVVRATPVSRSYLTWDASLHGNTLSNELVSLGELEAFTNSYRVFKPGESLGAWYVNRIREVDLGNNQVLVSDTAEYLGSQMPTFEGSLHNSLTLPGGIRLSAQFNAKFGFRAYNLGQEYRDRYYRNSAKVVLPPGEGGYSEVDLLRRYGPYVGETTGQAIPFTEVKEHYIQKADYIRFSELSLTVPIPGRFLEPFRLNTASLTLAGRNLGLWTDWEGYDPEILGTGPGTPGSSFYDQFYHAEVFTTPPTRRWTARLNIQF